MTDPYGDESTDADFPRFDDETDDELAAGLDTDAHDIEPGDDANATTDPTPAEVKPNRGKRAAAKRPARGGSKAELVQVSEKTLEILEETSYTRHALASLLGVDNDVVPIAVAVVTAKDTALAVINDLNEVSHADDFEAAVVAASLGRVRMKTAWRVLADIGAGDGSTLNSSDAKAGLQLARVIKKLDDEYAAILRNAYVALTR